LLLLDAASVADITKKNVAVAHNHQLSMNEIDVYLQLMPAYVYIWSRLIMHDQSVLSGDTEEQQQAQCHLAGEGRRSGWTKCMTNCFDWPSCPTPICL
jgi:lysylphosphatidylglycerol synthetase-like protein (DUF2156 family)